MAANKTTLRIIILAQCAGLIGLIVFQNGFMLAFLSDLRLSQSAILFLLALPQLMLFIFLIPLAYISDRVGKKKLGIWGQLLGILGLLILAIGPSLGDNASWSSYLGIGLFGLGTAFFAAGWFALLKPLIPREVRGRFLGNLRASWQIVGIGFTLVSAILLKNGSPLIFQVLMGSIVLLQVVRLVLYLKIPELEKNPTRDTFWASIRFTIDIPGYLPFCCYLFLLMLFVGGMPWIFNLLEKQYLGFTDDEIVMMGNLLAVGSFIGFFWGGKTVDRWGTRPIFLLCHLLFGIAIFAFVGRSWIPLSPFLFLGGLSALFGFSLAASSIASSTEMMHLIPSENMSVATALNVSMVSGGSALSGILAGRVLDYQILNKQWVLMGHNMNEFDAMMLGCGLMVILLVVTLGLIPSVTGQRQLYPVNRL